MVVGFVSVMDHILATLWRLHLLPLGERYLFFLVYVIACADEDIPLVTHRWLWVLFPLLALALLFHLLLASAIGGFKVLLPLRSASFQHLVHFGHRNI